jgi:hypothetical protein
LCCDGCHPDFSLLHGSDLGSAKPTDVSDVRKAESDNMYSGPQNVSFSIGNFGVAFATQSVGLVHVE